MNGYLGWRSRRSGSRTSKPVTSAKRSATRVSRRTPHIAASCGSFGSSPRSSLSTYRLSCPRYGDSPMMIGASEPPIPVRRHASHSFRGSGPLRGSCLSIPLSLPWVCLDGHVVQLLDGRRDNFEEGLVLPR